MANPPSAWWQCIADTVRNATAAPNESFPVHQAAVHAASTPDERIGYIRGVERQLDKARWHRTSVQLVMAVMVCAAVVIQIKFKG